MNAKDNIKLLLLLLLTIIEHGMYAQHDLCSCVNMFEFFRFTCSRTHAGSILREKQDNDRDIKIRQTTHTRSIYSFYTIIFRENKE